MEKQKSSSLQAGYRKTGLTHLSQGYLEKVKALPEVTWSKLIAPETYKRRTGQKFYYFIKHFVSIFLK